MDVLKDIRKRWNELTRGWFGYIIYAMLGILFAFLFMKTLEFVLNTSTPVTWVASSSMQHDNAEITHYRWLEENLNYNRSYIDSWPYKRGFLMGDMPIIRGQDSYNVGDIIVYTVQGQAAPIIHRIIKINPDGTYQTKGDNNIQQHPYELSVSKDQIHGKVIFIIPKLGYLRMFIHRIFGV